MEEPFCQEFSDQWPKNYWRVTGSEGHTKTHHPQALLMSKGAANTPNGDQPDQILMNGTSLGECYICREFNANKW